MNSILAIGLIVVCIASFAYIIYRGNKASANRKAKRLADWALDYHNPASVNYDAARVAQEELAAAAWAQDPHNPDSPNYDPNA